MKKNLTIDNVNYLLHKYWDPIGYVPDDEYISYAKVIYSLLNHNCSENTIFLYLKDVSENMIGLKHNKIKIYNVINKMKECLWIKS